jgi:predicted Fe-Mo cluster-binding NifX family protein
MKIAITASGNALTSPMDGRFGRAKWFIRFDTIDGVWQAFSNEQNLQAAQGAGIQAAQRVVELDAEAVVTGHVGPKAFKTLKAAGIRIFLCQTGTAQEAAEQMKQGLLRETAEADVEGHWV